MIRTIAKRMYTTLNLHTTKNMTVVYPAYNELTMDTPDGKDDGCLLYTSPSPRDGLLSRMPSSA